ASAFEKPTPTNEDEFRRKVRMFEHCWLIVGRGRMLRRLPPLYFLQLFSHRHLRYSSGPLHVVLLATSIALATSAWVYAAALAAQLSFLLAAALGVVIARYYFFVTWATLNALWRSISRGVPPVWEKPEGTR